MTGSGMVCAVLAHARAELALTIRRGESLLVTIIIPAGLLVFFASAKVLPGPGRQIDFLLPGTLTLAIISTGLVSLGIATAYERYFGILKRLGVTPLPRGGLIAAKMLSVLSTQVIQFCCLIAIAALGYGWRPAGSVGLSVIVLLLGTLAFSGLGLLMAGVMRAEATLALANGLFLFFLLLGGLYVPLSHLPGVLIQLARITPGAALADVLRSTLAHPGTIPFRSGLILLVWACLAPVAAALTFRWE